MFVKIKNVILLIQGLHVIVGVTRCLDFCFCFTQGITEKCNSKNLLSVRFVLLQVSKLTDNSKILCHFSILVSLDNIAVITNII